MDPDNLGKPAFVVDAGHLYLVLRAATRGPNHSQASSDIEAQEKLCNTHRQLIAGRGVIHRGRNRTISRPQVAQEQCNLGWRQREQLGRDPLLPGTKIPRTEAA